MLWSGSPTNVDDGKRLGENISARWQAGGQAESRSAGSPPGMGWMLTRHRTRSPSKTTRWMMGGQRGEGLYKKAIG